MDDESDCMLYDYTFLTVTIVALIVLNIALLITTNCLSRVRNPILTNICLVETPEQCVTACEKLKSHLCEYKLLAIDAEWVTVGKNRQPVALLQLCTINGFCALMRLNKMKTIPRELKEILSDAEIVKVGIVPEQDALHLLRDHAIFVNSTLDLRHLYQCQYGLAKLAKEELGIVLDKNFNIRCSDWERGTLTKKQIHYAAMDAYISIELFKKSTGLSRRTLQKMFRKPSWESIMRPLMKYLGAKFIYRHQKPVVTKESSKKSEFDLVNIGKKSLEQFKRFRRYHCIKKKSFYDNIQMQTPDGSLLSFIQQSLCDSYLKKNLAEIVSEEPKIIRLLFEPKMRKNQADLFGKELKQDQCVICGSKTDLLKHNVIPMCYKKLLPLELKSRNSHDLVLMCFTCKFRMEPAVGLLMSKMRNEAGFKAPEANSQIIHHINALLYKESQIPQERKRLIEDELKEFFQVDNLTKETMTEFKFRPKPPMTLAHETVISYYQKDGRTLIDLVKRWRQHFIDTAKPQFMPKHWSVDYNTDITF